MRPKSYVLHNLPRPATFRCFLTPSSQLFQLRPLRQTKSRLTKLALLSQESEVVRREEGKVFVKSREHFQLEFYFAPLRPPHKLSPTNIFTRLKVLLHPAKLPLNLQVSLSQNQ